jgi:hypothetical protein
MRAGDNLRGRITNLQYFNEVKMICDDRKSADEGKGNLNL